MAGSSTNKSALASLQAATAAYWAERKLRIMSPINRTLMRREARVLVKEMLVEVNRHSMMVKQRLRMPHRIGAYAGGHVWGNDQKAREEYKLQITVLQVMLAASNNSVAPNWAKLNCSTREQLTWQAKWLEASTVRHDFSSYWPNHWFNRVQLEMETHLAAYAYQVRTGDRTIEHDSFRYCEVLDALWNPILDPAAREAARRLGDQRYADGLPSFHPYHV